MSPPILQGGGEIQARAEARFREGVAGVDDAPASAKFSDRCGPDGAQSFSRGTPIPASI